MTANLFNKLQDLFSLSPVIQKINGTIFIRKENF